MARNNSIYDKLPDSDSVAPGGPYVALWRAVLLQAFSDITQEYGDRRWRQERHVIKAQAINWLTRPSRDLTMVCDMAGINPEDIIRRAKEVIAKHSPRVARPPVSKPKPDKPMRPRVRIIVTAQLELFA